MLRPLWVLVVVILSVFLFSYCLMLIGDGKTGFSMYNGNYLWQQVLKGNLSTRANVSVKRVGNIEFRFTKKFRYVAENAKHVIITLSTMERHLKRLKRILESGKSRYQNVGVIMLGEESCNNSFVEPYIREHGELLKFILLVYDGVEIDNKMVYQWPLGVYTKRHFPVVKMSSIDIKSPRKFLANFVGSATNPSRNDLVETVRQSKYGHFCYVKMRPWWRNSSQSPDLVDEQAYALRNSDLTFSPAGGNPECYRIYEAFSYGSVPVIQDTPCGPPSAPTKDDVDDSPSPRSLRLLKEFDAPVMYVKNWKNVTKILKQEMNLPLEEKIRRRQKILFWYEDFKEKMKERFLTVVKKHFFGKNVFMTAWKIFS